MDCSDPKPVNVSDNEINLFFAIREGNLDQIRALLASDPELATSRLGTIDRTPLHVATDWPGYFPNGPEVVHLLVAGGASVDARGADGSGETPLHWAASSDDADVAQALIDCGADLDAAAGSIGTPVENAVGYGCWNVARLLVSRGARIDTLWVAAALGLTRRAEELLRDGVSQAELDQAIWHACAGGQRRMAQRLLDAGASLHVTPDYGTGTLIDVASGLSTQRTNLVEWLRSAGVASTED